MRFALYTYINMYDGCSLITRRCHRANPSPITSRRCSIFLGFDGEIVRKWSDIVKSSSKEQNRDISDLCDEEIYISYLLRSCTPNRFKFSAISSGSRWGYVLVTLFIFIFPIGIRIRRMKIYTKLILAN